MKSFALHMIGNATLVARNLCVMGIDAVDSHLWNITELAWKNNYFFRMQKQML